MKQHRFFDGLRAAERVAQRPQVVAVDGSHVVETHVLEHVTRVQTVFQKFLDVGDPLHGSVAEDRDLEESVLDFVLEAVVGRVGPDGRKVHRQRADVRRDGHLVVVEDDDESRILVAGIVERLVDQTAGEGTVADDRDRIGRVVLQGLRHGQAVACRDGSAAVAGGKRVVFALLRVREAGEAAVLPERMELTVTAGQEFVRIDLVPDVPDERVFRGLEFEVHRKRQLDRAQIGRQMAAVFRNGVDDLVAEFTGQGRQLIFGQSPQIRRRLYGF